MARVSIGWVARRKTPGPNGKFTYGGWKANCKVYKSRKVARACVRGHYDTIPETEARWDFFEVFIETPDTEQAS